MGPMKDISSTWMYPAGVDISALEVANRDRNASGIWSMKPLMDGWDWMAGHTAAYMATIRARETAQASSVLLWSRSVFTRTLASMACPCPRCVQGTGAALVRAVVA